LPSEPDFVALRANRFHSSPDGNDNSVNAVGGLNAAFNLRGNNNTATALGAANTATQIGGNGNTVITIAGTGVTSPGLSSAFSIGGDNNTVQAGELGPGFLPDGGPFAIAGAIGTSNHDGTTLPVITQVGPGVNTKTALNREVRTPATVLSRSQTSRDGSERGRGITPTSPTSGTLNQQPINGAVTTHAQRRQASALLSRNHFPTAWRR
jgi:hypothetical protein